MDDDAPTPAAAKRRRQILSVSLDVFARDGFHNADVQDIADTAGVGKGTVYRHFGSKRDLFRATSRHCLEQLGQFVRERIGDNEQLTASVARKGVLSVLRNIASACALFYQETPGAVEIMIQERAEFRQSVPSHLLYRAETRAGLDELIRQALLESKLNDFDVSQATNAFADLIYGSVVNGCLEGVHTSLVLRVESAMAIFLHGLEQ